MDNFGNLKTSILASDIAPTNNFIQLFINKVSYDLPFYTNLKDVSTNELGVVIGSSGLGSHRFLEIVVQGGNASEVLKVKSGVNINF